MSSTALRSLFLELGFDVDLATLDKADARIREAAKVAGDEAKAVDEGSKKKKASRTQEEKEAEKVAAKQTKAAAVVAKEQEKKAKADKAALTQTKSFSDFISSRYDAAMGGLGKGLREASPAMDKLATSAGMSSEVFGKTLVGGVAAAVVAIRQAVHSMIDFANGFAALGEEIRDTSREVRVSTDDLQGFRHAAVAGGVGVERMNSALATFGASLRGAERWGSSTTFMLRRLGIQARDSNHHIRPTTEILDEVAVAMEHVQSPYRRLMVANQLFGESGRRMLDIMHTGAGGIRALREEMYSLGGGVSREGIAAARGWTVATERLSRAQDSLRSVLAEAVLPAMSWVASKIALVGGFIANLTRGTNVLKVAFGSLAAAVGAGAAAMLSFLWPILVPVVLLAGAVAAVALAADDLVTFLQGGDSMLGRFIDHTFGLGAAKHTVTALRDAWHWLANEVERAEHAVGRILHPLSTARGWLYQHVLNRPGEGSTSSPADQGSATPGGVKRVDTSTAERAPMAKMGMAAVPLTGGARVRIVTHNHGDIHVHGLTNPEQAAQRVGEILDERARNQRDADSPLQAQEG